MQKVDAPRDVIRETVIVSLQKQSGEEARKKRRLYELAGLPYDPKEEIQIMVLLSLMVEPYVNNIAGLTTDEEFVDQLKGVLRTSFGSQIRKEFAKEEEEMSPEDRQQMSQQVSRGVTAMVDSLLTYSLPADYQKKGDRYWKYVFELAGEKGIAPKDVFVSDELYKEVIRHIYTREEHQANIEKTGSFYDPDTLFEIILKPMIESLAEDKEEAAEVFNELKEEMRSSQEFQGKMKAMKNAFSQVATEEIKRIYG